MTNHFHSIGTNISSMHVILTPLPVILLNKTFFFEWRKTIVNLLIVSYNCFRPIVMVNQISLNILHKNTRTWGMVLTYQKANQHVNVCQFLENVNNIRYKVINNMSMSINKTYGDVNLLILGDALTKLQYWTNWQLQFKKLVKIHIIEFLATTNEKVVHEKITKA